MKIASRFENFPAYSPIEPIDVLAIRLGKTPDEITKLDANENPYGPCQAAKKALANLDYCHIYPDPESRKLRAALEKYTGVCSSYLLAGAGADELIDLILRVLLEPQDKVINLPPTFGMYDFDTRLNNGQIINIQRKTDFSIDLEAIKSTIIKNNAKVIFVTSPNNPDGGIISDDDFNQILELPVVVILDEAYIEFTGDNRNEWQTNSRIALVPQHDNLIVLRTFSKWAGLAGLRIGYGAFPIWLMNTLWIAKQPYNVSNAASEAAIASLKSLSELELNVQKIRTERKRLIEKLIKIPFLNIIPSKSNFVLCQMNTGNALELKQFLLDKGILVRHYKTDLLNNFIRISVGTPGDTDKVITALEEWK